MKNKRLTYVLLPVVIVVWIIIGYRFYNAVKKESSTTYRTDYSRKVLKREVPIDYELQLNYPDPFLKKEKRVQSATSASSNQRSVLPMRRQTQYIVPIDWNKIVYFGMIENNQASRRIGIVALEGVRKLVRKNDKVLSFTVEQIYRDSILVRAGHETKYIISQGRIKWLSR